MFLFIRHSSFIVLATILAYGCANIDHTSKASQLTDKPLFAGVGDLVLSVERQRNLKNAFGKSDIFGRKTTEGYTEIRFAGVEENGTVVLYRKDVSILSNETTMSRTPISRTSGTASTNVTGTASTYGNQTSVNAAGRTTYNSTTVRPAEDFHIAVPADTIAIRLDADESHLPISGYLIAITRASRNSLQYVVKKQD